MKVRLEEGVDVCLYKRYADDINSEVNKSDLMCDRHVIDRVREIRDDIHESFKLKADYPKNHGDGKVHILDLKIWISRSKILYEYYSKQISSKAVISSRS